ncbi:MAG TPA: single-stranded DNA-binding protein [Acidimicrobiales bacterium]|nr:single-stranded DNA-binding protein [Acidimicrobiales bacterium]
MNLVTLLGRLSRPAEQRLLPSGDRLVALDVTVDGPDGRAETVPVVWFDAPASAATLDGDRQIMVIGRVRRRFYRANGATQSRTEVVAETVVTGNQAKRLRAALRAAAARLDDASMDGLELPT